jgi:hypothetical protein
MSTYMRTLILGAAIGVASAVTIISPTQAGMIGAGTLQITEPASLVEPVRVRSGSGVSRGSTVRSGSPAFIHAVPLPRLDGSTKESARSAPLKHGEGRRVIYSATVEKPYTVRRGDTLSSIAASPYRRDRR